METWNYFLVFFIGSALMATTFIIYIARAYKKNYELRKEMGLNYQDAVAMIKSYFEENPDIKKAQFARQHNLNYTALRMIIAGSAPQEHPKLVGEVLEIIGYRVNSEKKGTVYHLD